jgi:hypothetical protein
MDAWYATKDLMLLIDGMKKAFYWFSVFLGGYITPKEV